jgi:hypothetical protein
MQNEWMISDYLRRPARSLREACRQAGRDEGGWRCLDCPLRQLCFDESRWLVKRAPTLPGACGGQA